MRFPLHFVQVGDKVELVTDYKEFGDAQNGPLRTGDRGTIDELYTQKGPKGNRYGLIIIKLLVIFTITAIICFHH